ncbi:MAG: enoyl-CoA hydratase/isomerase family protein [Alphaproteobacteria bacterium]
MTAPVAVSDAGDFRTVSLSRPDKANALSAEMSDGVLNAVTSAQGDGARAIILRGEGKHFCAGFDFGDFESLTDGDLALRFLQVEEMLQAVFHCPLPILALVQGRAVGAGADLASAAMRVVISPTTQIQMPGPRFGVILGTRRLAYRIGPVRARHIQIENRAVKAEEALNIGLADAVEDPSDWDHTIEAFKADYTLLDARTVEALADVTRPDTREADMAALARSVATPGLKARLTAFRAPKPKTV